MPFRHSSFFVNRGGSSAAVSIFCLVRGHSRYERSSADRSLGLRLSVMPPDVLEILPDSPAVELRFLADIADSFHRK
jgi:hypothetical protein